MMTDDRIVQLLHSGQQEAVSVLYDQYGAALFGVALRIVRSKELAEQVLQDAFLKIWRNSTQYDTGKGRLFTWMLNITRNTAIDATRTSYFKNYNRTDDITQLYTVESTEGIQPDTIGVRQMVAGLDDKYRVLIEKIYFEGYTQQEVEDELGIPIGTVKTRLRAAINQLRAQFSGMEAATFILCLEKLLEQ
jgi:RNA polymerase sigma-70 factor, ECF subfamily